ncbi:uncharacterized protein EHS24_005940 [Apiotrichum porosum]|uniref:RNase III domain-containing protein n=1 Tax=Apiotrichum porosum TaxID=105984 RepID=A0A427Y033_9TREE|nr:uncharacterized protein EHS24_005940 [Apiotrichum porosum]RSH84420.1 hypothetical protein EHS24_005940 [Apiotrichum porosum]
MLQDALAAPHLRCMLLRKDSSHSHLAFDGDAVIALILHAIGKKYTDHVGVRAAIVAHVGSNAALASVCLESGILDMAFSLATRNGKLTLVPTKVAADILEAVVAATYNLLGFAKTEEWFEEIARPWVEEVVRKLNF